MQTKLIGLLLANKVFRLAKRAKSNVVAILSFSVFRFGTMDRADFFSLVCGCIYSAKSFILQKHDNNQNQCLLTMQSQITSQVRDNQ